MTLPPYTIQEQDADLWECGVDLLERLFLAGFKACERCGVLTRLPSARRKSKRHTCDKCNTVEWRKRHGYPPL